MGVSRSTNSSYGLIQGNVVDNWYGAGIALVTGSEVNNMIEGNYVTQITGTGFRSDTGLDGLGYWSPTPDDSWVNNVATDINQGGTYSYGFDINAQYVGNNGIVTVSAYQGAADPAANSQSTTVNMNAVPLQQFSGNEVYGATPDGLSLWWLGTFGTTPVGSAGNVQNFVSWHLNAWGFFGYATNNLTIDGFVDLGDATVNDGGTDVGMWTADYYEQALTITNANIEGQSQGIFTPEQANGPITISDSFFSDTTDVLVSTMGCVNGASGLPATSTILQNDTFTAVSGQPLNAITMDYETSLSLGTEGPVNLIQTDQVFVYNYDGVNGDNFQVYWNQQAASFIVPQTNGRNIGSPASGLTNQQNWSTYGIAIAGAVAPSNATTMSGIAGLVVTGISDPDVIIANPPSSRSGSSASGGQRTTANMISVASGVLAQRNSSGLAISVDQGVSVAATIPTATAKSALKVGRIKSATGNVVAGPLSLSISRRNQVAQTAARSPDSSQLTTTISQD